MAESDAGGGGAGRWEDGAVIVLPAGSAAWRQQQGEHQEAPPPERALYKTRLCDKFLAGGRCAYEDGCTFAHGAAELRPPLPLPARRRPGAGEHADAARGASGVSGGGGGGFYGGKVCFEFRDKGACHWGDKCAYAHVSAAEVAEMRFAGGPRQAEHARRSATPPGRASSRAGGTCYAPAAARPLPPAPAVAAPGEAKVTPLELLSRKKLAGVYGDWPEQD